MLGVFSDLASAFAQYYGYKTLGAVLSAHFALISILIAFILVCLVLLRLLNRQFPRAGREPAKTWIFKSVIIFMISAFIFVSGFAIFSERRQMGELSVLHFEVQRWV